MDKVDYLSYINTDTEYPKQIGKTVYIFRNVDKDELNQIFIKDDESEGLWTSNYDSPKTPIDGFKLVAKSKRYSILFNNDKKNPIVNTDCDVWTMNFYDDEIKMAKTKYKNWFNKGFSNQQEYKLNIFNSHFKEINRFLKKTSIIDIIDCEGNSVLNLYKPVMEETKHIKSIDEL